ncbi:MAG: MgtC/SapB family protein, partial [Planctomycetota bacterium]
AGTIFIGEGKHRVKGLTTAAGIWMTCAVGATAGMGREATAIFSALLCWTILALGPLVTKRKLSNGEQTPEQTSDSTPN